MLRRRVRAGRLPGVVSRPTRRPASTDGSAARTFAPKGANDDVRFQLQLDPDKLELYRQRRRAVWPEMLHALAATGWKNCSLFLNREGALIGYFETDDLDAALSGMAATDVNAARQSLMSEYFITRGATDEPTTFTEFVEVFNLDQQLPAIGHPAPGESSM